MSEGPKFTTLEALNLTLNCRNFDSEKLYYFPLVDTFTDVHQLSTLLLR